MLEMACIVCFDLCKIMRLLKSTKRLPSGLKWLKTSSEIVTCELSTTTYILQYVEIDCWIEIWHIMNPYVLKGAIF